MHFVPNVCCDIAVVLILAVMDEKLHGLAELEASYAIRYVYEAGSHLSRFVQSSGDFKVNIGII